MSKKYYLWMVLSILLSVFTSCSNDENLENGEGTVNISKSLTFPVTFADYNEEVTTGNGKTRAVSNSSDTISHDFVNMDNGIVADVVLQRDTEKQSSGDATTKTRSIGNGNYTMLAYQGGVFKGEINGSIIGGSFTPNSGGNNSISLSPGNYDFVLYRSGSFTRNGNNLTITNPSEYVMLGRVNNYTITATPNKQQVPFVMRHAVSRVRVKVTAYKDGSFGTNIGALSLSAVNNNEIPTAATYDLANDSWSGSGSKTFIGDFPSWGSGSWTKHEDNDGFRFTSSNYEYLLPGANITKLNATVKPWQSLTIYGENLSGKNLSFNLSPVLKTEPNGSYLINITLRKNFLYLMSDGTTGLLSETIYGGGTKIPIGVVVSQSKKLAAALDIVDPNSISSTTTPPASNSGINDHYIEFPVLGTDTDVPNDDGYKYTWEGAGSADGVTIKGNIDGYSYFYAAAQYSPTLPAGETLSGSLVGKKWFLPSLTDVLMYKGGPGVNNISLHINNWGGGQFGTFPLYDRPMIQVSGTSPNKNTVDLAFIQVGGKRQERRAFYTSTLLNRTGYAGKSLIITEGGYVYNFDPVSYPNGIYLRPFIKY
ncbi:fimbrillin family protein [Prevotella sp. A2879]|uniref:Fimbrillin family protein n=1 Tax=Prevotella vespertina TaxID=2608404 RepID=A0A7C9HER2_9BACT|nr:fimbrillin family protein [Prevotella vespertina]MUL28328.1 fimbrillin family protein [Prevotella vespertina]